MTEFLSINIEFVSVPHGTDDDFEDFLDDVLAELEKIDCDVSLSASLSQRTASFATSGEADTTEARFLTDLRTALHAANCGTPSWPPFVPRNQRVEELAPA